MAKSEKEITIQLSESRATGRPVWALALSTLMHAALIAFLLLGPLKFGEPPPEDPPIPVDVVSVEELEELIAAAEPEPVVEEEVAEPTEPEAPPIEPEEPDVAVEEPPEPEPEEVVAEEPEPAPEEEVAEEEVAEEIKPEETPAEPEDVAVEEPEPAPEEDLVEAPEPEELPAEPEAAEPELAAEEELEPEPEEIAAEEPEPVVEEEVVEEELVEAVEPEPEPIAEEELVEAAEPEPAEPEIVELAEPDLPTPAAPPLPALKPELAPTEPEPEIAEPALLLPPLPPLKPDLAEIVEPEPPIQEAEAPPEPEVEQPVVAEAPDPAQAIEERGYIARSDINRSAADQLLANIAALRDEQAQAEKNPDLWEVIRAVRAQVETCWLYAPDEPIDPDYSVDIAVAFERSGTITKAEIQEVGRAVLDDDYRFFAGRAQKALKACSPFKLPAEHYALWRAFTLRFVLRRPS